MKAYNELDYHEQKVVASWFATWLRAYTHEVIIRVLEQRDEILANDFAMNLLKELHERSIKEHEDFSRSMDNLLANFDTFKEYDPHNHVLEHSKSYRDILHDMYIR